QIALEADGEWDSSRPWEPLVRKAAEAAIAESAYPDLANSGRPVELSVCLTGNEEVRALNAKWRRKDKPTNVLSFPMAEEYELNNENVAARELLLGDVILAHGDCAAEAAEKGVPFGEHAAHPVVHGTLHLLGYDHQGDAGVAELEELDVHHLAPLGIA